MRKERFLLLIVISRMLFSITCYIFFITPCLFRSNNAFSQVNIQPDTTGSDTLFFLNGEVRAVKIADTTEHQIRFFRFNPSQHNRLDAVEKDRIFSIKFSNGKERIIYSYDTLLGNIFSVLEAKMYMLGEQEADKHYRNKWPYIIGFSVGFASPLIFSNAIIISPIPAAVSPLHTLIPVIRIDTNKISNKEYLNYDTYLMGYERVARRKNFMRSMLGTGIGFTCGIILWVIIR